MKKIISLMLILITFAFISCKPKAPEMSKVRVFKVAQGKPIDDNGNDVSQDDQVFVYWYIMTMMDQNNRPYYYTYSSNSQLTSAQLKDAEWKEEVELPFETPDATEIQAQQIRSDELPEEVQEAIIAEPVQGTQQVAPEEEEPEQQITPEEEEQPSVSPAPTQSEPEEEPESSSSDEEDA